ncbi:hypothetical protein BJ741DRAFT_634315 [Chytriomyces cf. hyalinus JEL632]|nr:hypothetical protein BJ741DRAFT_634315 [Chytriomyces cf. hyalinus JEL632]
MPNEVNSSCKLHQMPRPKSVNRSLTAPSRTAPSMSINSAPAMPSRSTLESMPPEILDQIASLVSSGDIVRLCHAIRSFKYISQAMFDFARVLNKPLKPVDLWPRIKVRTNLYSIPPSTRHLLGMYSRILSKHGGYATVSKSFGVEAILGDLPATIEVLVNNSKSLSVTDEFFEAVHKAKKKIKELSFAEKYFKNGQCGPILLKMTEKWLSKLPIHELRFPSRSKVPIQILAVLHLAPMLGSLHLPFLKDCAGVALSECKLLRKLSISDVFYGRKSPEELVQQVVDIVKETKIQQVEVSLPRDWKNFVRSDLKDLVSALFLQHGWHEQHKHVEGMDKHQQMNLIRRSEEQTHFVPESRDVVCEK